MKIDPRGMSFRAKRGISSVPLEGDSERSEE
jgi:hypothetical protein